MNQKVTLGAMVDYISTAYWLPEFRSREGLREWVSRCRDLGIGRRTYALWNDFARQFRQMVRAHGGGCRVGAPILVSSSYGPHPDFVGAEPWSFLSPEIIEDLMLSAVRGGADELIFFYDLCQEYNGQPELWESLKPICRKALS